MVGREDRTDELDEDEWNRRREDWLDEENERDYCDGGIEEANPGPAATLP